MVNTLNLFFYGGLGLFGGFIGYKLKIPAGTLVGTLLMVITAKILLKSQWEIPKGYGFFLQVAAGVMVGASFHPSILQTLYKIFIPVVISCLVLVMTGIVMAVIFSKLGLLDISTGYMGTSPGAMTVLLAMSVDNPVSTSVITCFHLFRVVFVVVTAPLILKFISSF